MENIAEAAGMDVVGLTDKIVAAARKATTHRSNCEHLAGHVRMIGKLLDKLKLTDLMKLPATSEPLELLEEALEKALELVESCRDNSYLYMLSMGWSVVYQFRRVQNEIDRYVKLVPLISLVHESRYLQNVKESLQAIEEDHREYTLEEEDAEAQRVVLKPDRSKKDANILEQSLSRRYPNLRFHEALIEEKEKLRVELQRSQANNDPKHCRMIEHLIEVTESVVNAPPEKSLALNALAYSGRTGYVCTDKSKCVGTGRKSEDQEKSEWQSDLFDCCAEPCLSLKACVYPCGIFSSIAHAVSNREITRERALNDLTAYSLFCGCCCYTCCVRRKLRQIFNIEGGSCDDFLTHLMCCCCAMVQEWRELEARGFEGCKGRKMIPPPYQYMKP